MTACQRNRKSMQSNKNFNVEQTRFHFDSVVTRIVKCFIRLRTKVPLSFLKTHIRDWRKKIGLDNNR